MPPSAQNAKNYESNTGKAMNFGSTAEAKGAMKEKEEEPTTTGEQEEAEKKS